MLFAFLVWNRVWLQIYGYRFSGSGLKRGLKNHIFWSEIGPGFWKPCCASPTKILGSTPPPTQGSEVLFVTRWKKTRENQIRNLFFKNKKTAQKCIKITKKEKPEHVGRLLHNCLWRQSRELCSVQWEAAVAVGFTDHKWFHIWSLELVTEGEWSREDGEIVLLHNQINIRRCAKLKRRDKQRQDLLSRLMHRSPACLLL